MCLHEKSLIQFLNFINRFLLFSHAFASKNNDRKLE